MFGNIKAFPSGNEVEVGDSITAGHAGMNLRDYFAAKAMQGLLPARDMQGRTAYTEMKPSEIAESAYEIADAMMKAREPNYE